MQFNHYIKNLLLSFLVSAVSISGLSCIDDKENTLTPNQPPAVTVSQANEYDPSIELTGEQKVTLEWTGNDPDGFITAFMYRWIDCDSAGKPIASETANSKWHTLLNYTTYNGLVLMVDVGKSDAADASTSVIKYLRTLEMNSDWRNTQSPSYNPVTTGMFETDLFFGDTVTIAGWKVFAVNKSKSKYPSTIHTNPTSGTYILHQNQHDYLPRFEIIALDNNGMASSMEFILFSNKNVQAPTVIFTNFPSSTDTVFILQNTTATWPGINFKVQAKHPTATSFEYSWRVDSLQWQPWTKNASFWITGNDVIDPMTRSTHYFQVRARTPYGIITPPESQAKRSFTTIFPEFAKPGYIKKLLVINISRPPSTLTEPAAESLWYPSTGKMNRFFNEVLFTIFNGDTSNYTFWPLTFSGLTVGGNHPQLSELTKYSAVAIFQDNFRAPTTNGNKVPGNRYAMYLDVGGNIFLDGINYYVVLQVIDASSKLLVDHMAFLGLNSISQYYPDRDTNFIGAYGSNGYPEIYLDPDKLHPSWDGAIKNMAFNYPSAYGEIIYSYNAKCDTCPIDYYPDVFFEGKPSGIRYIGPTFRSVYLGFPLYYLEFTDAVNVMRKALQDLGQID